MIERWLLLSLVSAVSFGLATVLVKDVMLRGTGPLPVMLWVYVIVFSGMIFYTLFSGVSLKFPSFRTLLAGMLTLLGTVSLYLAFDVAGNPGYVYAVSSVSIAIATALSVFLLGLRINLVGAAGVMLIFAGIILLSMVR
ncbi:MAG: EamA family transporter [Candidatus Micrarchaeota archaeon]|nr:EamA family transporter [Candidatus Micrarchaeota archaeon]